ncbi:lysR substrate binding domain protein [Brucella grignonensis]|uniref:LysR substrate binding domain protein n=2 Tax=Brucella grignonensis TaxID=94627 RepID=A0A256EZ86_9HYPH|nr:lysR substrate binding domain protein [Brucella grignonensis]
MQDLNDLFYYVQVVSSGGFAAAARRVGVQKSTLSRRISLLEERLGTTLIYRTSRQFSVTEVGAEYYRRCLIVLEDADAAQEFIEQIREEPHGIIRMVCPVGLLNYQLSELIAVFMLRHPKIEIHLKCLNRHVDLVGEAYDLAIRESLEPHDNATLSRRYLGSHSQCLVASPTLFERGKIPKNMQELKAYPSLAFGFPIMDRSGAAMHLRNEWVFLDAKNKTRRFQHTPRMVTDCLMTIHTAARHGLGIGLLPHRFVVDDIYSGQLLRLLPDLQPMLCPVYAEYPSSRSVRPILRILLDYLAEAFMPLEDTISV